VSVTSIGDTFTFTTSIPTPSRNQLRLLLSDSIADSERFSDATEIFWTVAEDTTAAVPTHELIDEFYPTTEVRADLAEYESLVNITKAAELLDWVPQRNWRSL
jgi:hypothetical protein